MSNLTSASTTPFIETGAIYRGVVTHMRWSPVHHGFCYELSMIMINLDSIDKLFQGWWPLAGVNKPFTIASFRESDHLKLWRKPQQSLKNCLQDIIEQDTGKRPSNNCQMYILTHLAYWGYCFNPVSFYYIYNEENTEVETIIAEVSNTPWNEMHLYVLNPKVSGVECTVVHENQPATIVSSASSSTTTTPSSTEALIKIKKILPTTGNDINGVVDPTAFTALGNIFTTSSSISSSSIGSTSSTPLVESSVSTTSSPIIRKLRYKWQKSFHVSPFMSLDHTYDWIFTDPLHSNKLLVQSQNMKGTTRMFNTQLYLYKEPLTYRNFAYMVFILFPFLTWRLQWWIHYEAFRLWYKGVELYSYDTKTTNTFTNIITWIMTPIMTIRSWLKSDNSNSTTTETSTHSKKDN